MPRRRTILSYKKDGGFYSQKELAELYAKKRPYLERLAADIQKDGEEQGWLNEPEMKGVEIITVKNALFFLQNMEEEFETWSEGDYIIDEIDGINFSSNQRSSFSNRKNKIKGSEKVLTLDISKVMGFKKDYLRKSYICCTCGNLKRAKKKAGAEQEKRITTTETTQAQKPASNSEVTPLNLEKNISQQAENRSQQNQIVAPDSHQPSPQKSSGGGGYSANSGAVMHSYDLPPNFGNTGYGWYHRHWNIWSIFCH